AVLTFNGTTIADARAFMHAPTDADNGTPRVTTDTMLVTPDGNHVRALAGHYSGRNEQLDTFDRQAGAVIDQLGSWDGPTIWGADWNVASTNKDYRREADAINRAGLQDTFTAVGIEPRDPARGSGGRDQRGGIDRIYASDGIGVRDTHVVPKDGP